jgi:serine-type D-Ala-D-Ala carboxypeptidase (penicillin-binding protein 5/6)
MWLWVFLLFFHGIEAEPLSFQIKGFSAIVMNADSGAILYEHRAEELVFPASTSKVATALFALHLENQMDRIIIAELEALKIATQEEKRKSNYSLHAYRLEPDGSTLGIKKGEIFRFNELLQGMLICSGNDAANVIADTLGPSIPVFVEKMNDFLRSIGCQHTNFVNPHGLHHPKHQTTAFDLALLTKEALKIPVFREIISQKRFIRPKTNLQASTTLLQTNRLLRPGNFYYPKAIGVKTGYHSKAQKTLISAAQHDGRTLITVLLGYKDKNELYKDAVSLFELAFQQPKVQQTYFNEGKQEFTLSIPHADRVLQTYLPEALRIAYYPAEQPDLKGYLHWQKLELPIRKDQEVGKVKLLDKDGVVLTEASLLAVDGVEFAWPYRWWVQFPQLLWVLGFVVCFFVLYRVMSKK